GQTSLVAARSHLEQAKSALVSGDSATTTTQLGLASTDAAAARSATTGLPWELAASVPYLGQPFATARDLAQAVDDLVVQVLQPAAQAGTALAPEKLRPSGKQIDVAALVAAREPLAAASSAALALDGRVRRIPPAGYIRPVEDARRALQAQVSELATLLDTASTAATLLPPMLGADRPRTYLLAFQTNAEARGTGGLIGGFALITADNGELTLDTLASNIELEPGAPPGIDLGPDYRQQYAGYSSTTSWLNANSSPHFPYAAQIWSSLWKQQGGQELDGVIALDPIALSYVLEVTGPLTLRGGENIDAENVVPITESEAYVRFRNDNIARKDYLQSIAAAAAAKVLDGGGSTTALLGALGRATEERRLAVWSAEAAEQEVLGGTVLGHELEETTSPYASAVVLNGGESKLDYYLRRTLSYVAGDCSAPERESLVTVDLHNGAPSEPLPKYVAGPRQLTATAPPNTNRLLVSLYATDGAQLSGVSVDGVPTTARIGSERGHPVFTTTLLIPPGATQRVVFDLVEPTSPGQPVVPVQPLVEPMGVTVAVPHC
ncbi:MAG TPA: DUF4012 domain-containing protein, partial [Actinophytocola sp.]|nr:DUF4012 domain-containing protein [Actinophytocola sp.]